MSARKDVDPRKQAERLARLLMEAHTAAWVRCNPNHDRADWKALADMDRTGYAEIASELVKRGVVPPQGEE